MLRRESSQIEMYADTITRVHLAVVCLIAHCTGVMAGTYARDHSAHRRVYSRISPESEAAAAEARVMQNTLLYHVAPYLFLAFVLAVVDDAYERVYPNYKAVDKKTRRAVYVCCWFSIHAACVAVSEITGARFGVWETAFATVAHVAVCVALDYVGEPTDEPTDEPTKVPLLQDHNPASQPSSSPC